MPGVFEVSRDVPILVAVEDILLISECSQRRRMGRSGPVLAARGKLPRSKKRRKLNRRRSTVYPVTGERLRQYCLTPLFL